MANLNTSLTAAVLSLFLILGNCVSSFAAASADYRYLTSAYRARMPYAESQKDDQGRSLSRLIDHGDYYELTNVNLYVQEKYKAEDVEAAAVGDRLNVAGKAYKVISIAEDGERTLERKNAFGSTYAYLIPVDPGRNKTGYYIAVKKDIDGGTADSADMYYGGSVYLRKDCVMQSLKTGDDGTRSSVSAETYLTVDRDVYSPEESFRYGYDASEELRTLCGNFTLDEEGYFITYTER